MTTRPISQSTRNPWIAGPRAIFVRSGLTAMLYLAGGVPLVFAVAFALSRLPWHTDLFENPILGLGSFVIVSAGGGWLWGRTLERLTAQSRYGRLAWSVAVSFPIISIAAAMALGQLERFLVEDGEAESLAKGTAVGRAVRPTR